MHVDSILGEGYTIPTLGVWDYFDDIDFECLPNQFVLKCTHDSGGLVIVKDKSKMDYNAAKQKIETCLKTEYFWDGREWPYKDVNPRIIAEEFLVDKVAMNSRITSPFVLTVSPKLYYCLKIGE